MVVLRGGGGVYYYLRGMINMKIKGVGVLQGVVNQLDLELPLDRRFIWIGRGEEIHEKENASNHAVNLAALSKAISRIHACIIFSPIFFTPPALPSYFRKLAPTQALPSHILYQIWQFSQPTRRILLKDMHSKTGIYQKISNCIIQAGMEVVLGDSRPLIFQNEEIYDNQYLISVRLDELKQMGYMVLNQVEGQTPLSFWLITLKNQKFVLLNQSCRRIMIGRSSDCSIVILQASISRRHAMLEYAQKKWRIIDGDGVNASSNGLWRRAKKIWLDYRNRQGKNPGGQSCSKIGDVLFTFTIKQQHSLLGLSQCLSLNKSTDGSFTQQLRRELQQQQMPELVKQSSKF